MNLPHKLLIIVIESKYTPQQHGWHEFLHGAQQGERKICESIINACFLRSS